MKTQFSAKSTGLFALQWLGAVIAFPISLTLGSLILPLSRTITDATPPAGIVSLPVAMLLNGVVNATILIWAARRSSFKGLAMWMQLLVLSFGAQTFATQIETGYFLPAFPLLHDNFQVYALVLHGFVSSLIFTLLVVLLVGGFSTRPRAETNFNVDADHAVRAGAWLPVIYVILYMLFGYYVAWQSPQVRLFYGGTSTLPSVWSQWGSTLMAKPELPVFQYFRGIIWILCLIPLFKGFSGGRIELVVLSALALAYLPTVALAFPNPLMPAAVALAHFWEVSISMAIFGALCAWFVPQAVPRSPQD
jgi:hypothetical protein